MSAAPTWSQQARRLVRAAQRWKLPTYQPKIVRSLPHDEEAFTQGLAYRDGRIYESTGLEQRSSLRCIDADSGEVLQRVSIAEDWAEGVAISEDRLVQLSWKRQRARIFSLPQLLPVGSFDYHGEGWGLTSAPHGFVMSDGTSSLQYRDNGFIIFDRRTVTIRSIPVKHLNDLAFARERIFANVWYSNEILEICPHSGRVCGIVDCSPLLALAAPTHPEHVLNGITYREDRDTFYLTGKCWKLMFEVQLLKN